jgi:nicotinate dehydrogenase subunit A
MAAFSLKVNGQLQTVDVDPETPLLYVLSDELHLRGPKFGCGLAQCGACTVLVQGKVMRSCVMPVRAVKEREITTLEGLGTPEKPHAIQQAFIEEGAAQCGFCLSGVILTAKVLLDEHPAASDEQIQEALSNVLCRCFTHTRMVRAIKRCCAEREGKSEGKTGA